MTWNLISKDKVLKDIDYHIEIEKHMMERATRVESKLTHDYTLSILRSLRKKVADMYDE